MGLLTDPSAGQGKIIKLLLKYYPKLCFLLYIGGIIYFCLLSSPQINSATYFSENALLPGLVTSEFREEGSARAYYDELIEEMKKYDNSIPYPWLLAKLRQLGLDTYTHNFTLNYPIGDKQTFHGKNVYGIVRAPRAASIESLVLSVPYRPPLSVHQSTAPSIAIMLAFAKFAIKEKYWAKDIIFLITEHEQLGVQAWLEAYHGVTCGRENVLVSGDMKGRAGAIQAAINLELHEIEFGQIDIKIEGLNGQLPNLDLFNLATKMCLKEGIQLTFKDQVAEKPKVLFRDWNISWSFLKNLPRKLNIFFREWFGSFKKLLSMVSTQATGVPNGNHGLFYRFGIQAVTMEGFAPANHRSPRAGFYTMGRILEGSFRSLNNLLERFHQSFFFYLLPSTDRYISIGLYIPSICFLVATLFIKSYAKWCQLHENENNEIKKNDDTEIQEDHKAPEYYEKLTLQDWKLKFHEECMKESNDKESKINLGNICTVFFLSHVLGFSMKNYPEIFSLIGIKYGYPSDLSIYCAFAALFLTLIILPYFFSKPCYRSMAFLNIVLLIELGTTLICISMYNISLGMLLAAIYVPLALLVNPSSCGFCNKVQKFLWCLGHPFMLLNIIVFISTFLTFQNESIKNIIIRSFDAAQKALVFSVVDNFIYGNWLYNVMTSIFVSNWLCFWYVLFSKPKELVSSPKKND